MKKSIFWLRLLSHLFAMLFVYASVVKLFDFKLFQQQLSQSPLIGVLAEPLSYIVVGAELVIALLLLSTKFLRVGLYGFFSMMVMFSAYIYILLNYGSFVPCSCGGILEAMGWEEHLIFNLIFVVLSAVALYFDVSFSRKRTVYTLIAIAIMCCSLVGLISHISNEKRKEGHDFNRLYLKYPITKEDHKRHNVDRPYVIGMDADCFYLGSLTYPQRLYVFRKTGDFLGTKIYNLPKAYTYRNLKLSYVNNKVYMMDGSIPVLLKGSVMQEALVDQKIPRYYFTDFLVLDSLNIGLKYGSRKSKALELGVLNLEKDISLEERIGVLKSRGDSIFSRDGFLLRDVVTHNVGYVYYYNNKYLLLDNAMKLIREGKTIDNTTEAKIEAVKLKNGSVKKKGRPPIINSGGYLYDGILYILSRRRAQLDPVAIGSTHDVVDLYNINNGIYIGSIVLEKYNGENFREMIIQPPYINIIRDKSIIRYRLNNVIKKYFEAGEAENLK